MSYQPKPPPFNPSLSDLARYVADELQNMAQAQYDTLDSIQLNVLNREPLRPRDGTLAEADGVNWNPGSGAGCYIRRAGVWVKLG
jgi:hypothetical protein